MHDRNDEKRLSNEELIAALGAALQKEHTLVASVITMLMEVEDRRLHLELACPSMFEFCVRRLGMSEGEAYRRITVARLASRFPEVLDAVRSGRVHLSNLVLLRDLLTRENASELLTAAAGKTKRAMEELVARLAPKPDVPALIRKLPSKSAAPAVGFAPVVGSAPVVGFSAGPVLAPAPPVTPMISAPAPEIERPRTHAGSVAAQVTPLGESRHKVSFTASSELRQKLERAQSLMRHRNVDGDLTVVVERAVELLIAKLEKEKLAATTRPKKPTPAPTQDAHEHALASAEARSSTEHAAPPSTSRVEKPTATIPAAARREVVQRDGEQCAFVGTNGERCSARDFLEIDHRTPRALGGSHDVRNLRLLCRAHNHYAAERAFGREHVARSIHTRQRKRDARAARESNPAQPTLPMT